MEIVTGSVTTGENFFEGRKAYLDQLHAKLLKNDVLITGPRRTGKTSLIKEYLLEDPGNINHKYLYLSLEDVKSLYHFYVRLIREILLETNKLGLLAENTGEFIKNACNKLGEIFQGKIRLQPDALGSEIESTIEFRVPTFDPKTIEDLQNQLSYILSKIQTSLVIVLDEFPEIIFKFADTAGNRKDQTKLLMSGLRAIRQKMRFDELKVHKIIIAGSVNLENTLAGLGLADTINDLEQLKIQNLKPSESFELLTRLGEVPQFEFDPAANIETFVLTQFAYCTPFYIQLFADSLRNIKNYKNIQIFGQDHVRDAYKTLITGERGPNYFFKRLSNLDYYADVQKTKSLSIIKHVATKQFLQNAAATDEELAAVVPDNIERHQIITKLISDDFFQIGDGGNYRFDCQLICNFWNYVLNGQAYLK